MLEVPQGAQKTHAAVRADLRFVIALECESGGHACPRLRVDELLPALRG
jgi:hypothetical protein